MGAGGCTEDKGKRPLLVLLILKPNSPSAGIPTHLQCTDTHSSVSANVPLRVLRADRGVC